MQGRKPLSFLAKKEKTGSIRGCRRVDVGLLESLFYILLHSLMFRYGERVDFAMGHWLTWKEVDGTVQWSVRW